MDIQTLTATIQQLKIQAAELDNRYRRRFKPLFDRALFNTESRLLLPYVEELEQTFTLLTLEPKNGKQSFQMAYLSEKLVNQLSAIQRETNNQSRATVRKSETSISELYQDLEQHLEWENRLKAMIGNKIQKLEQSAEEERSEIEQALLTLEQRLFRCQVARQKIENSIARQKG